MSVEASVITLLVLDQSPKKAYQRNVTSEDFDLYDEEFQWIERQFELKRAINPRRFREKFPDFEWVVPAEELVQLLEELKSERAFVSLRAAIETIDSELEVENAIEKAEELRDILTEIMKSKSAVSDIDLGSSYKERIRFMKQLRVLAENGQIAGIPTGYKNIDHNWGGLMNGRVITVLGRSGEGKSFFNHSIVTAAWKAGYRVGFFSPEMNRHEHECRLHTLMSADPLIQQACGIKQAFRNRALMEGHGFPFKKYENFCEYLNTIPGRVILFTQQNRRQPMTAAYIESKVDDLNLDVVFIDPIYKLRGPRKRDSPVWELSDLIDEIENMAKSHDIPVVISNQSHRQRGVAARRRAPSKDTSYMSDALIHESDHVIGVRYDAEEKMLRLKCSKSRFGGEFDIDVKFHPNIGYIKETTEPKGSWLNGGNPDDDESELPKVQEPVEQGGE